MKSRAISLMLIALICVAGLFGCGGNASESSELTPSDIAHYWIIQNPGGNNSISFEESVESGNVGAYVFNEEGLFSFLINTKDTGSIVRVGSYEIEGDNVIVSLPELKTSKATADAIENAVITIDGDTLMANGISLEGSTTIAKRASKAEYQDYVDQATSHW